MTKQLFLLIAITTLLILNTSSQEHLSTKKTSVGIIGGGNYQTISFKDFAGDKRNTDFIPGFYGGADVEFQVLSHFYIRPGILYSTKGYVDRIDMYGVLRKFTYRLSYIEVPVNLLFKQHLGKGSLLFGVGPYVAFALNGKEKSDFGKRNQQFKNSLSLDTYAYDYLRRIDAGANLLAGYQLNNGISIQLNAQYGLKEMMPSISGQSVEGKDSKKNRGLGISIGYRFNGRL